MKHAALLLSSALMLLVLGSGHALAVPEVLSLSDESINVGVGPSDPVFVTVNATLRNPYPEAATFLLSSRIDGQPEWRAEVQGSISMAALSSGTAPVRVFVPRGEKALATGDLVVAASAEGKTSSWSAKCTVRVLPFSSSYAIFPGEYLLDMPLTGSFNITVVNDGNAQALIGVVSNELGLEAAPRPVEAGSSIVVSVPYSVESELVATLDMDRSSLSHEIVFYPDGEFVHILFGKRHAIIALPSLVGGYNNVMVMALGADARITSVEALDGSQAALEGDGLVGELQRREFHLDVGGGPGRRTVPLRFMAEMEGSEVTSNVVMVPVMVTSKVEGSMNVAPVIGGGAGALGVLAVGYMGYLYAASEAFRYRWLAIGLVPLYSLARGEKVLDHFFRGRLYEHIKENPGVSFTALKRHFGVNNGNLTYHLHRLEKEELVSSRSVGKFKLFYPDGVRMKGCGIVISLLDRDMMRMIRDSPGISTVKVTRHFSKDRSRRTVSRHLKDLERKGLIEVHDVNGIRKLYISVQEDAAFISDLGMVDAPLPAA
ncbi:MAG: hypothetical protein QCI82_08515 [Candidatus Thermoplasmatota archaeon]|nr:hypothetical protein [Candidatus Thermoplasmatota archaeon]